MPQTTINSTTEDYERMRTAAIRDGVEDTREAVDKYIKHIATRALDNWVDMAEAGASEETRHASTTRMNLT